MERGEETVSRSRGGPNLTDSCDALQLSESKPSSQPDKAKKPCRRWFHASDDTRGVKADVGVAAHVSLRGMTIERFEAASAACIAYRQAPFKADAK